jgi:GrpB-like predicted nucleotidyltransferase (UPF0157 family)
MSNPHYKDRKYHIEPYDPSWPKEFEASARTLRAIFGNDALAIEHIGSTSVPGMDGKPTIDILILVDTIEHTKKYIPAMEAAGYEYLFGYVRPDTILFRILRDSLLLSNVHVYPKDHPHVHEMLALRSYLRSHPKEVEAYSNLKKELFKKYPDDYGMYRKLKDEYMKALEKRAFN